MDVSIIGLGQTEVKEMWDTSIRHLAWYAIEAALDDAHVSKVDALFVGNMAAGQLSNQMHLGALVADFAGLRGIEAVTVEAADASGGAALRQAVLAVKSGLIETALVVGVEKMTDRVGSSVTAVLASTLDADYEAIHGLTVAGMGALLMRRYLHEYSLAVDDFANFSVNAHANGADNPLAMFRNRLKAERFASAPPVATPVSLFDAAPSGDGAAAVIVTSHDRAQDMVPQPVRIVGSSLATDTLSLHDRKNMLHLRAAELSAQRAMQAAGDLPLAHQLCSQDEEGNGQKRRVIYAAQDLLNEHRVSGATVEEFLDHERRHAQHEKHLETENQQHDRDDDDECEKDHYSSDACPAKRSMQPKRLSTKRSAMSAKPMVGAR